MMEDSSTDSPVSSSISLKTLIAQGTISCGRASSEAGSERDECDNDTDLEVEVDTKSDYDLTGRCVYMNVCKRLGTVPAQYFIRHMQDEELSLRYHGLGAIGVKAIALPLWTNTSIVSLDLSENWVESTGAGAISSTMKENLYITDLNLAGNKIGSEGAEFICKMLEINTTLKSLDLTGNDFRDKDAGFFASAILENNRLRDLNLSNNSFGEEAGRILSPAIGENETLEFLDLSWNNFRRSGAVALCEGIKVNARLKVVNLAYNGLSDTGAYALAEVLKQNNTLLELDVTDNRIYEAGAIAIGKALENNENLKTLKIGRNPIGRAGGVAILKGIAGEHSIVSLLDMQGIEVNKEFVALGEELKGRREVEIKRGIQLANYVIIGNYRKKKDTDDGTLFGVPIGDFQHVDPASLFRDYADENANFAEVLGEIAKARKYKIPVKEVVKSLQTSKLSPALTSEHAQLLDTLLCDLYGDSEMDLSFMMKKGKGK